MQTMQCLKVETDIEYRLKPLETKIDYEFESEIEKK